jgi:hypothetical protein
LASIDAHEIHCLEAVSGKKLWSHTAGGRIDSPPTLHNGTACFGSADGTVTCLRLSDGALAWRFRAAPEDLRTVAYGQVESLWPVHGSVLIRSGVLHFVAGRSMYLDGGLLYYRLDPATGKVLGYRVFDDSHPDKEGSLMQEVRHLTMPVGLPDVLSSDGKRIYMRSQMMSMEGERQGVAVQGTQKGEGRHLFSPAGFLDDTWWHRSYWLYGRSFSGGYGGYPNAGKHTPAGKMLVFNGEKVFGYGRKPQYYRWTTPMEYQLFSAPKDADAHTPAPPEKGKRRSNYHVKHDWVRDIPVWVRAMLLSEKTLIVAGPPDLIDEEEAARKKGEESMERLLADQLSALRGGRGALMNAFSTETGEPLWSIDLESPPVFDGMAAANGRLFLVTLAGEVVCFSGEDDSLAEKGCN